jgi:hypothetical protein
MTHIVDDGTEMVPRSLFDEAVRLGSMNVSTAARHVAATRVLADAIEETLALLSCGKIGEAHDRLRRAARVAELKLAG